MKTEGQVSCDVLVVGAGLAGLRAAYDCAKRGLRVLLAAKGRLCSGASFYPLTGGLGAQLPLDERDQPVFLEELLDSGAGIADEKLCRILVEEIEGQVARLPELGIQPKPFGGRASCFAKTERRLVSWSGWADIRKRTSELFGGMHNVTVMELCDLLRVVTRDGVVTGAFLCDSLERLYYVRTPAVILATGGYCGLYKHSLNTDDVCGIGHSAALDAGARLINLEFMQFIPGLMSPVYKLLFGEVSLWYCTEVTDENGGRALEAYLPRTVSLEECLHDRSMHGPFTSADNSKFFELAMMDYAIRQRSEKGFQMRFDPAIDRDDNGFIKNVRELYAKNGIDLGRQPISIAPFAHCANGGIWINEHGETGVPGLFAAGEAAGGIHGADRHGGAATSVCLVFGHRVAERAADYVKRHPAGSLSPYLALRSMQSWLDNGSTSSLAPQEILTELRQSLWYYANVLRSERNLGRVLDWVKDARTRYNAARAIESGGDVKLCMKAFHALRTSEALLQAMLCRRESRGPHYRADFPEKDESLYGKRVVAEEQNGIKTRYLPSRV